MEWIKCNERLPKKDGVYLIICNERRCSADYQNGNWYTNDYFDEFIGESYYFSGFDELVKWTKERTSHWMEIPAKPKDE